MEAGAYLIYMCYFSNGLTLAFLRLAARLSWGCYFALKDGTTRHKVNKNDEGPNRRVYPSSLYVLRRFCRQSGLCECLFGGEKRLYFVLCMYTWAIRWSSGSEPAQHRS